GDLAISNEPEVQLRHGDVYEQTAYPLRQARRHVGKMASPRSSALLLHRKPFAMKHPIGKIFNFRGFRALRAIWLYALALAASVAAVVALLVLLVAADFDW